MSKRAASEEQSKSASDARHVKRQRVETSLDDTHHGATTIYEDIVSARQLQNALIFEQGSAQAFRTGLGGFKQFLDSILHSTEVDDLPRKRAILREYLASQKKGGQEDQDVVLLPNIFQAWEYAAETHFEALNTQVTAILALLLRVFSIEDGLKPFGDILCKIVLRTATVRRLSRNLSAPPAKEHIIAPALRLLTEVTNFEEGSHAKAVYAKRDSLLDPKILGRNLGLGRDQSSEQTIDRRKASLRTQTIKYLLSHIRHQDETSKVEILSNWNVIKVLFEHLHSDPPHMVIEVLKVLKAHVFLDKTIPRSIKGRILSSKTLSSLASLYKYHVPRESLSEGQKSPDVAAHEFLTMVCTSTSMGILLPSHGFYPPLNEDNRDTITAETPELDMGIYDDDTSESIGRSIRVRNVVLSDFLQTLRPYANVLQEKLVLDIFKACPELVADYFIKKETFSFEPSLTSTWVGYSNFVFQTMRLPVPQYFGNKRGFNVLPPPASVTIQSILPQPLTQQVLGKCLSHRSLLINNFAIHILLAALQKLGSVLQVFSRASLSKGEPWELGKQRLIAEFCKRCPPMKVVFQALKRSAATEALKRESTTRLLRLFYEIIPQVALEEKLDVSILLCNALTEAARPSDSTEHKELRILELEHWVQIARHSPAMRWFQKHNSLQYSPFMTILKLVATSPANPSFFGIKNLLVLILRDVELFQMTTMPTALDAFIASLKESCDSPRPSPQVLEFLDDCFRRFSQSPLKYFDDLEKLHIKKSLGHGISRPITPLLMTMVQQWPFRGGSPAKNNPAEPLVNWLTTILYLLMHIGEDAALLEAVRESLVSAGDKSYQGILNNSFKWKVQKERAKEVLKASTRLGATPEAPAPPAVFAAPKSKDVVIADLEVPPAEDAKHTALNRWRNHDLEQNIEEGHIADLLLLLCSTHREIRLQAVTSIRLISATIDVGREPEYLQLKLLLEEAVETALHLIETTPLPFVAGVLAARSVRVVVNPAHVMYGKVNEFLMKSPFWEVENIPRTFFTTIIRNEPAYDESYHQEVEWFIDYLLDCLRTGEDLNLFMARNIVEKILAFYESSTCAVAVKEKIIRLLFRIAAIEGSATLITRCGILGWVQMRLALRDQRSHVLQQLASRLYEACDKKRVEEWTGGLVQGVLADMAC